MTSDSGGANEAGDTYYQAGAQAEEQRHVTEAFGAYKQALAAYRGAENREGEGRVLRALGSLAADQKLTQEAVRYYEQALAIVRTLGDRRSEAITLGLLSNLSIEQARYDEADRYLEESLKIAEAIGDADIANAARTNLNALRRGRRMWLWRVLRLG